MQGLHQVQKQTQTQVLAPQLRQSLKLLQVPALELRAAIAEELETNPTLEELVPSSSVSLDAQNEAAATAKEPVSEASERAGEPEANLSDADYKRLNELSQLDADWKDHFAQDRAERPWTQEASERRQHFFDSLTQETSLQEHLMEQARLGDLSAETIRAMEVLIGTLDDRGFLTQTLEEVALMAELPLQTVQAAHARMLKFEPTGIGAADVREALLLQLEQLGEGKTLPAEILRTHYALLLKRRIPELARKTSSTPADIEEAIRHIATLDPAPGRQFAEDTNRSVMADATVIWDTLTNNWRIQLNSDYIPRLRIHPSYKALLGKGTLSGKDKEFIRDKMRSGKFLMTALEQRQQTLERLTQNLITFQNDFFVNGPADLRPLTMNQVAEAMGVHETTVSRAISGKYLHTPHGLFPYKHFFTPGYQSESGEVLSNKTVKERIAVLIEAEPKQKPLSDQKIAEMLKTEGLAIARRTVAKYREELGISPTHLRRRYD